MNDRQRSFEELRRLLQQHKQINVGSILGPEPKPNRSDSEQRRRDCMENAMTVFSISSCGMAGRGGMTADDIVPLARDMLRFMDGD